MIAKEHAEFITVTCLERVHILKEDRFKDIVIDSLRFLSKEGRIRRYGFVIMSNHFHLRATGLIELSYVCGTDPRLPFTIQDLRQYD